MIEAGRVLLHFLVVLLDFVSQCSKRSLTSRVFCSASILYLHLRVAEPRGVRATLLFVNSGL